jgi:hypothetical protein
MNKHNLKDVFILETEDYHEFSSAQKVLKAAGLRYNFKEIGMRGTNYRAVFFHPSLPPNADAVTRFVDALDGKIEFSNNL